MCKLVGFGRSALETEARAIYDGMNMAITSGYSQVSLRTDSATLARVMNNLSTLGQGGGYVSEVGGIIDDYVSLMNSEVLLSMASNTDEILHEFSLMGMRVYKDGRIERYLGSEIVPPSIDPETGVQSKDVTIDPETGVSARLYIPNITDPDREKLPLVVYFHGGGFCVESAFSPTYQNFLNPLVAEARVVLVSVDYRRAPEHPLPIAYDDSWAAVKWVNSHSSRGPGKEDWLLDHADFNRVFFGGDSAGANIAHHMGTRVGSFSLLGSNLVGIFMLCPYFFWKNLFDRFGEIGYRYWELVNPHSVGSDDPCMNPGKDPKLSELACRKVLVCVAEKDYLLEGAKYYYEVLRESNWGGVVEVFEEEGEEHIYFLVKPTCEKTVALIKKVATFLTRE